MKTKKIVTLGMFTAVALTIFVVESYFPPIVPIPGIKMGLANVVTMLLLFLYHEKDSFTVLLLRIILGSIFTGQAVSFIYSLFGGIACFFIMALLYRIFRGKYSILVSMTGAVFHNLGQIAAAMLLLRSYSVLFYLPILMLSALITGFFTGCVALGLSRRLKKLGYGKMAEKDNS
ncbi:MAG: Gx transporter family protein [Roseburia sp.]|nr:Gx transporter family protein [Roseburia sp.]MCM1279096.1 Gx transporter family protein [Robinsoniella sp.]